MTDTNALGQLIGAALPDWKGAAFPAHEGMDGRTCKIAPLSTAHLPDLFRAFSQDQSGASWTYLPHGPFDSEAAFCAALQRICFNKDPQFYTVLGPDDQAVGMLSYLRIDPTAGSIEIGFIHFSPAMQRTAISTETLFHMIDRAFSLGYRRVEWKCNALNTPSRQAAIRLGFTFEGIFFNARVEKGRNRDTSWYAIIDTDWPRLKRGFQTWLLPENFDAEGRQRQRLDEVRRSGV